MAVTFNKEEQAKLDAAGKAWNEANQMYQQTGDAKYKDAMDQAHADAEAVRATKGYSGGDDGSQHIALPTSTGGQYVGVGKGSDYYAGQYMSPSDQALLKSYGDAYNNATTDAEREAAHAAAEALRIQYGYKGGDDGSDYIPVVQQNPGFSFTGAPTYSDPYSSRIDEMLNEILNRDKFSYNAQEDELFKQYQDQYTREGQRAMKDTLGQVAARTGGLASSYATSAAMQQNNYYMQQLSDKIPELYQLAYQMYLDDIDLKVQDLGLLEGASDRQYSRFRDTMADWRDDRDFAYGMYRDDIADGQWQSVFDRDVFESDRNYNRDVFESDRNYDYNVGRDQVEDERYEREWDYNVGRDALEDSRYDQEWAYKVAQDAEEDDGYYGGPEEDKPRDKDGEIDWSKVESESLTEGLTGTEYLEKQRKEQAARNYKASVINLNAGMLDPELISELYDYGAFVEIGDNLFKWAEGWNEKNYLKKLKVLKEEMPVVGALNNFGYLSNFGI